MTRADKKLCAQIAVMIPGSVLVMCTMGFIMLWLWPPGPLEQACVSKPLLELAQCLQDNRWTK